MKNLYCFLIILITLNTACKKGEGIPKCPPRGNVYVQEYELIKVPYNNFAELTFVDSLTNDTHVFYGGLWDVHYWFGADYSIEWCDDPKGRDLEMRALRFQSPTYPYPIDFRIGYFTLGSVYINVEINHFNYFLYPGHVGKPYIFDSLNIRNKVYKNIEYFKDQKFRDGDEHLKYGCYYNVTEGLVKIELPEGGNLELINIKN